MALVREDSFYSGPLMQRSITGQMAKNKLLLVLGLSTAPKASPFQGSGNIQRGVGKTVRDDDRE